VADQLAAAAALFTGRPITSDLPEDEAARQLAALAEEVAGCTACKLHTARTHTVPGEGHPRPAIAFVGEGPGADEDRTGRPFVGRAGRLLDDIITKGMGRRREDVFIGNVVKCRPPGNRTPEPDECHACGRFLERQLEILAPRVICALGATAARHLLDTDLPMGRLRGGSFAWRGIPVIPTYHPAYLLRNPAAKRPTWEDIQRVMEIADRR
jgi:DNA polymerase